MERKRNEEKMKLSRPFSIHLRDKAESPPLQHTVTRCSRRSQRRMPKKGVPGLCGEQVAVFDTAFHQTMPPAAYTYALPLQYRREGGVRKYGFHGTSYKFLVGRAAAALGRPESELNLIIGHIGCRLRLPVSQTLWSGFAPPPFPLPHSSPHAALQGRREVKRQVVERSIMATEVMKRTIFLVYADRCKV